VAHLRDGLVKRTLDFLVTGAHKAGTTSLFEYLRTHPRLYLPPGKERPFFSNDDVYARGWDDYLAKTFFAAPEAGCGARRAPSSWRARRGARRVDKLYERQVVPCARFPMQGP
jgi:hypothetical protein